MSDRKTAAEIADTCFTWGSVFSTTAVALFLVTAFGYETTVDGGYLSESVVNLGRLQGQTIMFGFTALSALAGVLCYCTSALCRAVGSIEDRRGEQWEQNSNGSEVPGIKPDLPDVNSDKPQPSLDVGLVVIVGILMLIVVGSVLA